MTTDTQNTVLSQANGEQGATSYGPRLRNKASPSKHGNQDVIRTIELQLDGDVQTYQEYEPLNETQFAFPDGCLILDAFAYSDTGMASLSVQSRDGDGNIVPLLPGVAIPAHSWVTNRDLDVNTNATTQLIFFGLAAGETATVYITFLQTATDGGEDGVLKKPRVEPVV